MATTRKATTLSCGCERRMPKATAMRRLSDRLPVNCAEHGEQRVVSVEGPDDLKNLLRF